jgi:hypothetical protein
MKNFIYSSILMGGQLNNINLPATLRNPVKMPSPSAKVDQKSILDKRQGYCLILDLPIQENQQKKPNNNLSASSKNDHPHIAYSDTIMGCNYKAFIEKAPSLKGNIDQEHLYNYLVRDNSNKEVIN